MDISEENITIVQQVNITGEYESIKFSHCTFKADVFINATVEGTVDFIECIFEGNSRLFIEGGEYKKDFRLSITKGHWVQITGGKFLNFHLGYWGSASTINEINIDQIQNIEGKLQFYRVYANSLLLRGQNDKTQFIFEDCKFSLVSIYRFINTSAVRFQNITSLNSENSTEFNIQDSSMGATEFFYVDFDDFSELNLRNSFIGNCIFIDCKLANPIQAKIGSGVSKGEIDMLLSNIDNAEKALKEHSDERFLQIFKYSKKDENEKLSNYRKRLKIIEEKDLQYQKEYRKENYKQLKYTFYKTGDRISERFFHGREMEELMKIDIPTGDWLILKFSKWSSDFGQSLWRPILFNGGLHILLCFAVFGVLNYQGYYFTIKNHSWPIFWKVLNESLYLFVPLKSFNKDILILDILMKINSGLFIYNILRAIRKYFH